MTPLKKFAAVLGMTVFTVASYQASPPPQDVMGNGKDLVMFTITASNVYGANQIKGAEAEAEKLGYKLTVFQNNSRSPSRTSRSSSTSPAARSRRRSSSGRGSPMPRSTTSASSRSSPR